MIKAISEKTGISIGALLAIGTVFAAIIGGGWTLASAVRAADLSSIEGKIKALCDTEADHRTEVIAEIRRTEERLIAQMNAIQSRNDAGLTKTEDRLMGRIERLEERIFAE